MNGSQYRLVPPRNWTEVQMCWRSAVHEGETRGGVELVAKASRMGR